MADRTWALPLKVSAPASERVRNNRALVVSWLAGFPRQIPVALLVAAGYYLGTKIGFLLTPKQMPIATYWPSNAVLLASFLLTPYSMWWVILLAVLPAHLLVQLPAGVPIATACGWFVSNGAEALLGAACIRHFKKPEELFETVPGVLVFLGFAVVFAPLASSFVDAAVVVSTGLGNGYWRLWTARLFSNMLAELTVAPTIILLVLKWRSWVQRLTTSRVIEALLLAVGIIGVSCAVFGNTSPTRPALMYSPLPLLVWIVVRFGVGGLYPSLLSIALISMWNVIRGRDPFILAPMAQNILGIQIFLSTVALPMMLLAAVLAERRAVTESLRQSRRRLIDAQEQERRRIARELHDDIGQQLTLLQLELDQVRGQSAEPLKPLLDKLYRQASDASDAARTISHKLHSVQLEFLGLVPALRNLCDTVRKEASVDVVFTEENVPTCIDPQLSLCLYRVTQEALHNVARHSHAHKVAIRLLGRGEWLSLYIADDGVGIAKERGHAVALGLESMRERVVLVGGTFTLASGPMSGTRIEATIPLKSPES